MSKIDLNIDSNDTVATIDRLIAVQAILNLSEGMAYGEDASLSELPDQVTMANAFANSDRPALTKINTLSNEILNCTSVCGPLLMTGSSNQQVIAKRFSDEIRNMFDELLALLKLD